MIVVCEPVCWGSEHVSFNAGILETIVAAFPEEKLLFYGERLHLQLVQRQMRPSTGSKISWNSIAPPERKARYLKRVLCEIKIVKDLILAQDSPDQLVLSTIMPSTLLALKLCKNGLSREITTQVVLHGALCGVATTRSRHPVRRLQDINSAIAIVGRRNVQYLVLEASIRELLLKKLPFLSGRVEVFEHPLTPNEGDSSIAELVPPIRFGFLGLANEEKGFQTFVELAFETVKKHGDLVEFHALGMAPADAQSTPGITALTRHPVMEHLSREDFVAGVKRLHFTVFPYKLEHYALSPSGTLLDAIAWGKPIIAARIPIFENLFKRYGNIGYLFCNITELKQIVQNVVTRLDSVLYLKQALNLAKIRTDRTPIALAPVYRAICKRGRSITEGAVSKPYAIRKSFLFSSRKKA